MLLHHFDPGVAECAQGAGSDVWEAWQAANSCWQLTLKTTFYWALMSVSDDDGICCL